MPVSAAVAYAQTAGIVLFQLGSSPPRRTYLAALGEPIVSSRASRTITPSLTNTATSPIPNTTSNSTQDSASSINAQMGRDTSAPITPSADLLGFLRSTRSASHHRHNHP